MSLHLEAPTFSWPPAPISLDSGLVAGCVSLAIEESGGYMLQVFAEPFRLGRAVVDVDGRRLCFTVRQGHAVHLAHFAVLNKGQTLRLRVLKKRGRVDRNAWAQLIALRVAP